MKVFVIGLDGATLDLIAPWVAQGELPNLARLLAEGASGELTTVIPPMTAPAWTSFVTGVNPGKHGIIDFVRRREGSYAIDPVNATHRGAASIWQIAGSAGRRVGAINVPISFPPEPVNGFMVSGLLTPSGAAYTHPPDLAQELDRAVGGYRIHMKPSYARGSVGEFLDDLPVLTRKQVAAALHLMRSREWDLLGLVLRGPDGVQHATCHATDPTHPLYTERHAELYSTAILDVYRQTDAHLGELVAMLDDDTTLVLMSDHGFGPLHRFIYLNNWLMRWGLLRIKGQPLARVRKAAFGLGVAPVELYDVLLRLGLGFLKGAVTKGKNRSLLSSFFLSFADVDWERTTAYAVGNGGQVFVNLRGREPHGIVEPGQAYERVVQEIVDRLHTLVDPMGPLPGEDGAAIAVDVYRRDELYHGAQVGRLPDVVFLPRDLRRMPFGEYEFGSKALVGPSWSISGTHRMNGVVALWGPGVKPGTRLDGAQIVDLAPTILALLGVEIPPEMDGRVLEEAFEGDVIRPVWGAPEPPPTTPGQDPLELSEDEQAEIAARLRGLGYIG
jgi:predicted AlkP superfamily phosphohydrolase/phosphomutase